MSSKNNTMSATKSLFLFHIHVLWDAPIIFFQPLKLCNENTEQDPKGPRPDDGIKESIKAPVAMSWSRDLSNILVLLDVGEWFSGFRVLSVMFLHSPNLNEKVWKRSHYLVSLFSFFFSHVACLFHFSHTFSWERGCSCEMMKFQGKVDVPSITGGGKVQINHLISPAFSPLSWGSRARGKSINLHKWDMTQRSLCLYTRLCTYLTLALSLYHNSDQLPSRCCVGAHHWTRCKNNLEKISNP